MLAKWFWMIDDEAVSVQDQSGSPPQMTSDPWRNVLDFSSGERAHTVITHTYIYIYPDRDHTLTTLLHCVMSGHHWGILITFQLKWQKRHYIPILNLTYAQYLNVHKAARNNQIVNNCQHFPGTSYPEAPDTLPFVVLHTDKCFSAGLIWTHLLHWS